MQFLKEYETHESVEQLNKSVNIHLTNLQGNERKVLRCLAKHALQFPGTCCLKGITIANELGISRATVTRMIKALRDKHIIMSVNKPKLNGIKGANIYQIVPASEIHVGTKHEVHVQPKKVADASVREPSNESTGEPSGMSHRASVAKPCATTVCAACMRAESFSFNQARSNFKVNEYVDYVRAMDAPPIRAVLKSIYEPNVMEESAAFQELCKIAFGRLKQFMRSHKVPYEQMRHIVIRCMEQLVMKSGVRNEFAMYSSMIERQVQQLFEQPIVRPTVTTGRTEMIPDWFYGQQEEEPMSAEEEEQLEKDRQRVLAKLGLL